MTQDHADPVRQFPAPVSPSSDDGGVAEPPKATDMTVRFVTDAGVLEESSGVLAELVKRVSGFVWVDVPA